MRAVKGFKRLVDPSKAGSALQSILGDEHEAHFVEPPMEMDPSEDFPAVGLDENAHSGHGFGGGIRKGFARHPMLGLHSREDSSAEHPGHSQSTSFSSRPEYSPASSRWHSGVFEPERKDSGSIRSGRSQGKSEAVHETRPQSQSASPHPALSRASSATTKRSLEGTRGHARDPLEEDFPYLFIGPSTYTGTSSQKPADLNIGSDPSPIFAEPESTEDMDMGVDTAESDEAMQIVSESPGAAEFDIYETAYAQELERIKSSLTYPGAGPKVYLTRRVEGKDEVMKFVKDKALDLQIGQRKLLSPSPQKGPSAFSAAVSMLRDRMDQKEAAPEEEEEQQRQEQEQRPGSREDQQGHTRERRESHPPSSALSLQPIPGPEASSFEATGVPVSESHAGGEDSKAQLRRLLSRAHDKFGG